MKYVKESDKKGTLGYLEGVVLHELERPSRFYHREYPKVMWENLINSKKFRDNIDSIMGEYKKDYKNDNYDVDITKVATSLKDIYIDEDKNSVLCDIYVLDTPRGRDLLKDIHCFGENLVLFTEKYGIGNLKEIGDGITEVNDYELKSINLNSYVKECEPNKEEV